MPDPTMDWPAKEGGNRLERLRELTEQLSDSPWMRELVITPSRGSIKAFELHVHDACGVSVRIFEASEGATVDWHAHDYLEIIGLFYGAVRLELERCPPLDIEPGYPVTIEAGVRHRGEHLIDTHGWFVAFTG